MLWLIVLTIIALAIAGFFFSMTTKRIPRTWYEWKTEFRYQYIGLYGLIDDAIHVSRDRVALFKQPNRVAVITGGNRGIGLRIVEKLLACDMTVIMGVRDPKQAEKVVSELVDLQKSGGKLICEQLDIGELESVKKFAQKIKQGFPKVDILLNNAGIMFAPFKKTTEGFEQHFAVNYLGHCLLTHLLLPQMKEAGRQGQNARIVNVSSCVNKVGKINYNDINGLKYYYPATAYSQSKLAQIMFTCHLQKLLDDEGVHVQVHAVHPGIVDTDLFEHTGTTAAPFLKTLMFKTPERGARGVVYAAIDPAMEGKGGTYLSNCGKGSTQCDAKNPEKCKKLFDYTCKLLNIVKFGNGEI